MIQEKMKEPAISPPGAREESLVGVIPDIYRGKGLWGKEHFNVIVTTKRLIFALVAPPKAGVLLAPSRTISPAKYMSKTTEEILSENKRNLAIEKDQIRSVDFTPGHSYTDCCNKTQEVDGNLEITSSKASYSFRVPLRRSGAAKDILGRLGIASLNAAKAGSAEEHSPKDSCCA